MVHVMSAEWGWADRCGGPKRGPRLKPDDFPTVETLTETWERVERGVRQFLSTLNDETLARRIEYDVGGYSGVLPLGELMYHAAIHGVHHRGQAALLLRVLGHVPGNFDPLQYFPGGREL